MIVIQIYKDNAEQFAGITSAVTFDFCKRRLRLYFTDLEKVKKRIIDGEVIDIPYMTLQKDRRVKNKKVNNECRKNLQKAILK